MLDRLVQELRSNLETRERPMSDKGSMDLSQCKSYTESDYQIIQNFCTYRCESQQYPAC